MDIKIIHASKRTNNVPHLTIATVSMQCSRIPSENLQKMLILIGKVKQQHPQVDLIFFGETAFTWYDPQKHPLDHYSSAEQIPGPTTNRMAHIAKNMKVFLCFGMVEQDGERIFNTQVLIDPDGDIITKHRKWNLKETTFTAGDMPFTLTQIGDFQTALLICSDAANLYTMRQLMKAAPDLILLSLADDMDVEFFMAEFNAHLYATWLVSANRFGKEFTRYWNGNIVISNPNGKLVASSVNEETVLIMDLVLPGNKNKILQSVRKFFVRIPLIWHIIFNWRIARSYFS